MIDLYYWPTPNGWKVSIALEELGLPYNVKYVNIGAGEQFEPEFLAISPNNRMPAIVDHEPTAGGAPISVFESGAILLYLAEKTGGLLSGDLRQRTVALEWLMWQMGGLGPMCGQVHHFTRYAPEPMPYAIDRYVNEAARLYGVLDGRLRGREYICDDGYSIADIACWGWVAIHDMHRQDLADFPNVARWHETMQARPGVQRGFAIGHEEFERIRKEGITEEQKKVLFGQKRAAS